MTDYRKQLEKELAALNALYKVEDAIADLEMVAKATGRNSIQHGTARVARYARLMRKIIYNAQSNTRRKMYRELLGPKVQP